MTVENLTTTTQYATWALAIAAANVADILEDINGAVYSEDVVINGFGGALTLRRRTGVAKPTIQGTDTASTSALLVANTVGVVLSGLILSTRTNATNAAALWVGVEGGRGAAGVVTLTVSSCDFIGAVASSRCIQFEGSGSGNIVTTPFTDCTFAGTYTHVCKYTGGGPDDSPVTFTTCTTTGVVGGAGSGFWVAAGFSRFTANRCYMDIGTGYPFSFNNGVNSIIVIVRNCRFFGAGFLANVTGSGGAVLAVATIQFNTIVSSGLGVIAWVSPLATEVWAFSNNILVSTAAASAGAIILDVSSANALTSLPSNYNSFYRVNTTGNFTGSVIATDYATLADWQAGTAKDANSVSGDPLFYNIATGDLHIYATSNCVGAGVAVGGVTVDLDGQTRPNPPSIGAYEIAGMVLSPIYAVSQLQDRRVLSAGLYSSSTGVVAPPGGGGALFWQRQEDDEPFGG